MAESFGKKRVHSNAKSEDASRKTRLHSQPESQSTLLVDWGRMHGANIENVEIKETASDDDRKLTRGAYASKDIPPNSEICFIPSTILLSESDVRASEIGKAILTYIDEHQDAKQKISDKIKHPHAEILLAMAAFIVHQVSLPTADSHWLPYLASLPKNYALPLMWTRDRIQNLLGGTSLLYMIIERLEWIQNSTKVVENACGHYFPTGALTVQSMQWATCSIWSRAFPKAKPSLDLQDGSHQDVQDWIGLSEICLFPILDMFNHKRGYRVEWRMTEKGVSFITPDGICKGSELLNNYGPKGNENLLSNYGFVIENNPEDYFKVFLGLQQEDPLYTAKKAVLEVVSENDLSHLVFLKDDLPTNMISISRVLVANSWELAILEARLTSSTKVSPHSTPICLHNEILALSTLYNLLNSKLKVLKSTTPNYEQDTIEFPNDDEARKLVHIYRAGQQSILEHAIQNTRTLASMTSSCHKQYETLREYIDDCTIHLLNPHLSPGIVDLMAAVSSLRWNDNESVTDEEDWFDSDTWLMLILANEIKQGAGSHWSRQLADLVCQDQVRQKHLGEITQDIQDHFSENIRPRLDELEGKISDSLWKIVQHINDQDKFVTAACAFECNGATLESCWVNDIKNSCTESYDDSFITAIVLD
ncbi:hypothetical protein BDEG_23513 [Batrachochytrium dendrobatidis JEL423]|uniref:SET domain-containing protein n=1 Tax=Batrachochytrium dendrobatidis (strain JEL423) TaxID=403673 RepID=A0A177WHZ2_BATDL|nr:hypothetical protein BDEG_23513 [Batrachochytrium dendrobatidis JEL423]